jgi:Flavodoxins
MTKAIIVYGSTTGTTETLAMAVAAELKVTGMVAAVMDVSAVRPEELMQYDLVVLGCSTWGDGELQDSYIPFEKKLRDLDLKGKKGGGLRPGRQLVSAVLQSSGHSGRDTEKMRGAAYRGRVEGRRDGRRL